MVEFLTTKGVGSALESIIRRANEFVYLVSYSFSINSDYISRIETATKRGVKVYLTYGIQINQHSQEQLNRISNLQIRHQHNLHAKLYLNETEALLTSMNFYDYSEKSNIELGVLIRKATNLELYNEIFQECKDITHGAIIERPMMANELIDKNKNIKKSNHRGFCIHCKAEIEPASAYPYCMACWTNWKFDFSYKGAMELHKEVYCHFCGRRVKGISFARPLCENCEM